MTNSLYMTNRQYDQQSVWPYGHDQTSYDQTTYDHKS